MATVIRFRQHGKRGRHHFRLIVTDSRKARDSEYLELLGHYNPADKENKPVIKKDRIMHWLKTGAELSLSARNILKKEGIIKEFSEYRASLPAAKKHQSKKKKAAAKPAV